MKRALALLAVLALAGRAHADGAFPDELQIFLPAGSSRTVLATNFGLLESDGGADWALVCEALVSGQKLTSIYQLGTDGAVYAASEDTIERSHDLGCDWQQAPSFAGAVVTDLFADPTVGGRVFAVVSPVGDGAQGQVLLSTDGAQTFSPLLPGDARADYTGVESARSDPSAIYVAGVRQPSDGGAAYPFVLRSGPDGGWRESDFPALAGEALGIAEVDPTDARRVYFRVEGEPGHDQLAVTADGAQTIEVVLQLQTVMSAFTRASDGTLYVGSRTGELWVSSDGGFSSLAAPKLRCLGERGNLLYGCGDDVADGFALATSSDRGAHWTPLLRFQDVQGLAGCAPVQASCQAAWSSFANVLGISVDAGSGLPPVPAPPPKGCGCGTGAGVELASWLVLFGLSRRRGRCHR